VKLVDGGIVVALFCHWTRST